MIYPRTQIAKRWYRVSESAQNVLEIYTGKPLGVATTCDGFDTRDVITKADVEYYNPKYGKRLVDGELSKLFPYIEVTYTSTKVSGDTTLYKQKRTDKYIDPNTGKEIETSTIEVYPKRVDRQENTTVSYTDNCLPVYNWSESGTSTEITERLWLDNMVEEGDGVANVSLITNGISGFEPKITFHSFTNIDTTKASGADSVTYADEFENGLMELLMDGLDSGLSFTDAYNRLPWYVTGSRKNNDGSTDTVVSCKCICKKGTSTKTVNIKDDFGLKENGEPNAALLGKIKDMLNKKAQECVDNIYEDIVVKSGLEGLIIKLSVRPFSVPSSGVHSPATNTDEDPDAPVSDVLG